MQDVDQLQEFLENSHSNSEVQVSAPTINSVIQVSTPIVNSEAQVSKHIMPVSRY